jgi:hypothetical protein
LPWAQVAEVGVIDQRVADEVDRLLPPEVSHRPPICVRPEWYY